MKHNNPYELTIMAKDIARRIDCDEDDIEAIELERNNFGEYCLLTAKKGVKFENQLEAWDSYNEQFPLEPPKKEMVMLIEKDPPMTYESEIKRYFEQSAQFGNYTDTLGQQ